MRPEVRANWCKLTVGVAKRASAGPLPGAIECVPMELRERIRGSGFTDWEPGSTIVGLADAFERGLGDQGAIDLWRRVMLESFSHAVLKPLIAGALALYGREPRTLFRVASRGWRLMTRDLGRLLFIGEGEGEVETVQIEDVPPEVAAHPAFLHIWHGCLLGAIEHMGAVPRVTAPAAFGEVTRFEVRWTSEGSASPD